MWQGVWESNPLTLGQSQVSASIDLPPTRSKKTNFMVRPAGVEPATIRVGGGDSIHLSYGRLSVWHARKELNPQPSALEAPALPIELPTYNLAETVRFELTSRWVAPAACFPSRSLRPLGHVSMNVLCSTGWARTSVPFQAL